MEKERETIRTRTENEDGEHYRSRRGAVVPRAGWEIEQVEERKEGVLCGAHAQHELENASENGRSEAQQGRWRPCATSESRVTRG